MSEMVGVSNPVAAKIHYHILKAKCIHPTLVRQLLGSCLAVIKQFGQSPVSHFSSFYAVVRKLSNSHWAVVRQSLGSCGAVNKLSSSSCQAVVRKSKYPGFSVGLLLARHGWRAQAR